MYQIPELSEFPKLFHAFSMRADGNMSNSILGKPVDFEKVLINRQRFLSKIKVGINKCVCMWVTHGDEIIEVPKESLGVSMNNSSKALKVDGLMTSKKGIYLFLLIADCLPIILYDPVIGVISSVHAGWKGVGLEIARKCVEKMQSEYSSNPKDIVVGIGPHAHKDSFIKEDPAQKDDPRWRKFIDKDRLCQNGKGCYYKVDLMGFTKKQLLEVGVLEKNIYVSGIDTVKDKRFFSHVRERDLPLEKQGRFACVVGMI